MDAAGYRNYTAITAAQCCSLPTLPRRARARPPATSPGRPRHAADPPAPLVETDLAIARAALAVERATRQRRPAILADHVTTTRSASVTRPRPSSARSACSTCSCPGAGANGTPRISDRPSRLARDWPARSSRSAQRPRVPGYAGPAARRPASCAPTCRCAGSQSWPSRRPPPVGREGAALLDAVAAMRPAQDRRARQRVRRVAPAQAARAVLTSSPRPRRVVRAPAARTGRARVATGAGRRARMAPAACAQAARLPRAARSGEPRPAGRGPVARSRLGGAVRNLRVTLTYLLRVLEPRAGAARLRRTSSAHAGVDLPSTPATTCRSTCGTSMRSATRRSGPTAKAGHPRRWISRSARSSCGGASRRSCCPSRGPSLQLEQRRLRFAVVATRAGELLLAQGNSVSRPRARRPGRSRSTRGSKEPTGSSWPRTGPRATSGRPDRRSPLPRRGRGARHVARRGHADGRAAHRRRATLILRSPRSRRSRPRPPSSSSATIRTYWCYSPLSSSSRSPRRPPLG